MSELPSFYCSFPCFPFRNTWAAVPFTGTWVAVPFRNTWAAVPFTDTWAAVPFVDRDARAAVPFTDPWAALAFGCCVRWGCGLSCAAGLCWWARLHFSWVEAQGVEWRPQTVALFAFLRNLRTLPQFPPAPCEGSGVFPFLPALAVSPGEDRPSRCEGSAACLPAVVTAFPS